MTIPSLYLQSPDKKQTLYAVTRLDAHPDVAVRAWRLTKGTGEVYDLRICPRGWTSCDCPAWFKDGDCKHVRWLRALGLLVK